MLTEKAPAGGRRFGRAVTDISLLTLTTGLGMVFAFLFQVILTRALPPDEYGGLSTALAAIALLSPLAGLGVGKYWLRVFGAFGWDGVRWIAPSLWLAALGSAAAVGLLFLWSTIDSIDPRAARTVVLLLPTVLLYPASEMLFAKLQLEEAYRRLALWQAAPHATRLLVAATALAVGADLRQVAFGLTAGLTLLIVLFGRQLWKASRGQIALVGHEERPATPSAVAPGLGAVMRGAWPFALSGMFYLVYYQSDVVLVGWLDGPEAAGVYNVAFAVMAAVFMLPSVVHQKYLLPKLHRWIEHDKPKVLAVYRFGNGSTLALGVVVAIGLYLVGPWALTLVFGEQYAPAGAVLRVLAVAVPARYLATSAGAVLATEDNMRRKVWLMGLTALVNLSLNVALIPRYGIHGAAWATVASETVLVVCYLAAVRRYVFGADALKRWTVVPGGWN